MSRNPTEKEGGKPEAVTLPPGLYLVATPIGNMRDITLRALDVLAGADLIVCEDTRVSGKLLQAYNIKKPLLPYNDHNADRQRGQIVEKLAGGKSVAMISDAGMPLISDPGYKLIRDCIDLGFKITSLPGANAPLTALQLSGLPSDKFCFLGFLPPKSAARRKLLGEWKNAPGSLIAFETAPRLLESLADIEAALGGRMVAVTRELTKMFEEVRRGSVAELLEHYNENGLPKGEIVLVIAPPTEQVTSAEDLDAHLREALKTMSTKEAAAFVAEATGTPRKILYEMALKVSREQS